MANLGRFNPLRWRNSGKIPEVPSERQVSREENAGFWSLLSFAWLSPLMSVGYRRPLERGDIWLIPKDRSAAALHQKLEASFNRRVATKTRFPLAWALYDTFTVDFWVGGICQLLAAITQVLAPFVLRYLITFSKDVYNSNLGLGDGNRPSVGVGMAYVIAIGAMQVIQSFALGHFDYRGMRMGGEARAAIIALAFGKSLRISTRAKAGGLKHLTEGGEGPQGEEKKNEKKKKKDEKNDSEGWSNGRIMSLIATDAARIEQACGVFHLIWTSPFQIVLTVALLIVNLGVSSLAGVAVLVAGLYALTKMMKPLTKGRAAINHITDRRVGLTQELLQGIRFVKYFAWEAFFLQRLKPIRASETKALQAWHATKSAIGAVSMALPIFSNMTAFIVYSITSHDLEPATVFSSLALFNGLRTPMNWLPVAIGYVIDAYTALKRTEEFLLAEDAAKPPEPEPDLVDAVCLEDASFTWEEVPKAKKPSEGASKKSEAKKEKSGAVSVSLDRLRPDRFRAQTSPGKEKGAAPDAAIPESGQQQGQQLDEKKEANSETPFRLQNITLHAPRSSLIGIIGTVGSGKTSLLSALASDMRQTGGHTRFATNRAYCPQYAWIQNASIRDNILFGKTYDPSFYADVVRACALLPDFDALPDGDQTEIGERGITLSGGQKQRINIARAIYSDAGIVLLDDPLSAVDSHVGAHIFEQAICGLLKDKCRFLATHQLHFVSRCDQIVWMVDGKVEAVGTYEALMDGNKGFAKMFASTGGQHGEQDQEEGEENTALEKGKGTSSGSGENTTREGPVETKGTAKQLMQEDVKVVDSVSWAVYVAWMRASGSLFSIVAVLVLLCLFRAANILTSIWLSWWVSDTYGLSRGANIGIYAALGVIQGVLLFAFSLVSTTVGTTASRAMSNEAMWQILRAPMSFFDTTPLGRIIHRFTKDVDTMDNNLTDAFRQYLIVLSTLLGVFGLIIAYFYYFVIALAGCTVLLALCVSYYRRSARELKRHHAILDGAVFARFSEALLGTACIRAYGREEQFVSMVHRALDDMDSAYFLTFASQRWLSVRLDNIGGLLTFVTGVLVVTNSLSVSPSIGGLILSYSLSVAGIIQITIKYLAEVDNSMCSTERLHQYTSTLAQEAPLECEPRVRESWPEKGEIVYEAVQMRYRPELPLVVDNFSLHIRAGERIGIVGRTGAGKSTILSTLFRLTELAGGRIQIDGVDISRIGLHELRSQLAIIPQDPTLFRGTIRSNIDPFNKHTDLELWDVLRQAYLLPRSDSVEDLKNVEDDSSDSETDETNKRSNNNNTARITLDGPVSEEGLNLSLGQRQLLALARALLRSTRIVLVDEGTSSVDPATDARIQETLANGLKGKTLIAIAHRLRTVLLYDRVCVMERGKIVELGNPRALWEGEGGTGVFRGMCDASGISAEDFGGDRREGEGQS
ncbi:P-loop containing nucleoside triphosphate hydrolase protein [Dichotomopilus funicola]|uniref:P-loop containing nucleoside triphosphate hydrolase protein n=1 Tax=Dichotomopilus funicola TaxID=1934379 RepID=A0AAN6ZLL2_9PEZI|nr:P-loop containing nucleoside triphosphate hydrolase protein [Dichotomopilus funicola]